MIRKFYYIFGTGLLISLLLPSCFEEDHQVPPHVPGDEKVYELQQSMYTHQSFFHLGSDTVVSSNLNSAWMLGFASGENQWHITVNSGDFWGIYPTGATSMEDIPTVLDENQWKFDKSDGNPDSTAIGSWVRFSDGDTSYSGEIYLLGRYDGIKYRAAWRVVFTHTDRDSYGLRYAKHPGTGDFKEINLSKNRDYNFNHLQLGEDAELLMIEPPLNTWDFQFTQYGTIIFTDDGIPTPYYVRGVLINPSGVGVAVDSITAFSQISFDSIVNYEYSDVLDFIGYEWKDVTVDVGSGTAVYTVRSDYTYIIRGVDDFYYKLRFVSFLRDDGSRGYPVFEYMRL